MAWEVKRGRTRNFSNWNIRSIRIARYFSAQGGHSLSPPRKACQSLSAQRERTTPRTSTLRVLEKYYPFLQRTRSYRVSGPGSILWNHTVAQGSTFQTCFIQKNTQTLPSKTIALWAKMQHFSLWNFEILEVVLIFYFPFFTISPLHSEIRLRALPGK